MIEMKGSTYDKAFELIDKAKMGTKTTKYALCELEECLEHCQELDDNEDYEYESDYEDDEITGGDVDINIDKLNYSRAMRRAMRRASMYRDDDLNMHRGMRRSMRRRRTNRYSY